MENYIFNLNNQFNQQQVLDEINTVMGLRLWNETSDDNTSDGESHISEDGLVLSFKVNLTNEQIIELNSIIDNYVFDPNYDDDKLFKLTNSNQDPTNIDYDVYGLHKKLTIIFGELRVVEYYRNYNPTTRVYSDLVVKEFRDYFRDINGLVQYRNQLSEWYLNDGTIGATKSTVKYYSLTQSIQEGLERRGNIISQTKAFTLASIGQLYSFDLLTSVKNELLLFIDGYTQPLRDGINNSTKPYLNQTIKDGIIENLRLS